ncbi:hypothetical protein CAOG_04847 [Capsaspora owczarzaki ATCC 30864]|uniref:Uncharacterized protein n=1 Tax=Capsaspora owczarzaki (strain ATCC 30864) TaxID=595528 RepID=A0A0D2WS33_CAPO3|nr:hypothetical protein CAOG_04847 [Capsaspora owczarzaki ATCC 30864]KJE94163.1 hypothetical protein CAOG_004847 [Capsaspora owczarzaki ATCC 30864]|eukprot:XP_004347598.2 hypothetical protein CAOG_04847 [Capsaspora owczarzaki ATCC 30864]
MAHAEYQRDPCPYRILDDLGGGFAMGTVGGSLFHALRGYRNSPKGQRMSGMVSAVKMRGQAYGTGFAMWAGTFSTFDCVFMYYRGKEDPWNAIGAGAVTGAVLAARSGPAAMATNAVVGAIILGVMEGAALMMNKMASDSSRPVMPELPQVPVSLNSPKPAPALD